MSILVVCRKCRKSFNVSDKFAGQKGPCPNCKATLQIPKKEDEVKIHGAEEFADGGRSTTGELLTKPITREVTKLRPVVTAAIAAAVLVMLLVTWAGGSVIANSVLVRTLGLLVITPALALAGYTFLRDADELEPYRGKVLLIRSGICSAAYMIIWGILLYISTTGLLTGDLLEWLFVAPPLLAVGALAALASFDLDFSNAFFHYAFYLLVVLILRWIAGMDWIWEVVAAAPA
ncbi:MAG: hypothetical protein HQ567_07485 [Candidatus Nealsonbacteria bacterium]|nr:hypothetical protein [Candidatus Nealsonbacteria bacterium]